MRHALRKPYKSKMADEKLCPSVNSRRGLGVTVQDVTWFPEDIVHIERELLKHLFITWKQKELRKSGEASLKIPKWAGIFLPLFSNTGASFLQFLWQFSDHHRRF